MAKTKIQKDQLPPITEDMLPESTLSPVEFETPEGETNIVTKKSWLDAYIDNRIAMFVGDVLSAPGISFGTSTDTQNVINWTAVTNATGYVLQVLIDAVWTTIYTGPLLTYTHTGLTASTNYDYQVKATAEGYTDSAWATGSKTTEAEEGGGGEYIVERRISLDLQGEYGSDITEDPLGITWNTWKPTNAQIQVDGDAVKSALVTEANVATAIGVVNVGGWSGNTGGSGAATGTPPYPLAAINGGFTLQSTDVGIKFTGANLAKFYQVYVLSADSEANAALDITAGGATINKVSTNNYPPNGTDRYAPTQLAKFYNIVPNGSGEFTISFHKTGSYYQASVSLILIEESNIAKP